MKEIKTIDEYLDSYLEVRSQEVESVDIETVKQLMSGYHKQFNELIYSKDDLRSILFDYSIYEAAYFKNGNPVAHLPVNPTGECIEDFIDTPGIQIKYEI